MQIENDFFPLISGELGDTLEQTNQLQTRLDQFVPVYEVYSFLSLNQMIGSAFHGSDMNSPLIRLSDEYMAGPPNQQ